MVFVVLTMVRTGYTEDLLLPSLASPSPTGKEELPSLNPAPPQKEELPTFDLSPASPGPGVQTPPTSPSTQSPVTIFQAPQKEEPITYPRSGKNITSRNVSVNLL